MRLSIADEIRKMKDFSYLPMPTYLYIEKYGKGIENDMPQICQSLGCKDWVIFPVGSSLYRDNPICGLLREIEKKQEIGREFSGCICIEFGEGLEDTNALNDFLTFIKRYEEKYHYIFTLKNPESAEYVEELLRQLFYIRRVDADGYDMQEIHSCLQSIFAQNHMETDEESILFLEENISRMNWKEKDQVANMITGVIQNRICDKFFAGNLAQGRYFDLTDAKKCIEALKKDKSMTGTIGFRLER